LPVLTVIAGPNGSGKSTITSAFANLPEAVRISDRAVLYDNSGDEYRTMLEVRRGVVVWIAAKPLTMGDRLAERIGLSFWLTKPTGDRPSLIGNAKSAPHR
jgi:predicted ABC-type ATPase